ncbi:unnamed protein product [Oppiella nova]|uniref:Major facilitator superfamily (MFS) profile domain-containing protein n=1 Tax=Oppiella nova TaxID=334625 RepID=A0A7R9M3U0_9ACAR|nr:unnamed protein product [Oppiella nova]CAG2170221.1 unnamed protein product [Oppiella nova]
MGTGGDAVNLMVFFGLSNAFGRAFFGYIADFPSLNRIILYGLSVLSYGVAIAPDGGWGWVVVFGCFMISLINDGFFYTTGLFYAKFLTEYHESEAITSLFNSIMMGIYFCSGTGIGVCGTGIGIAIFALLSDHLIETYGWKGAMLLLSGLMFSCVAFSSLFRKVDYMEEKSDLKTALKETFDFRILTDVVFVYFSFANFLYGAVYYVPIIFLKDHVVKTGMGTGGDAVNLIVYFGLSNAFGRVLFGYIADFPSLNRIILYGLSVLSYGVAVGLIAAFGQNYTILVILIIIFGLAEGLS